MDAGKKKPTESPPVKVVGFHVEGASPSPRQNLLSEAAAVSTTGTGSDTPMIILPMFPNQSAGALEHSPTALLAAAAAVGAGTVATAEGAADALGLRSIRTESQKGLDPDSFAPDRSPPRTEGTPRAGAIPLTPIGSAPAAIECQLADAVSPRIARDPSVAAAAAAAAAAAVAAAVGLAPPAAVASATVAPGRGSVSPRDPAPAPTGERQQPPAIALQPPPAQAAAATQQQQQQQQGAAPSSPRRPAKQQAVPQQKQQQQQVEEPAKKSQKEMTKAERRALQEAQRAAKAAAKAAAPASTGGGMPKASSSTNLPGAAGSTAAAAASGGAAGSKQPSRQSSTVKDSPAAAAGAAAGAASAAAAKQRGGALLDLPHATRSTELFAHLQQYKRVGIAEVAQLKAAAGVPLPAVLLGVRMAEGQVRGANARCLAMLDMFVQVIQEFRTPAGREFAKDFSPLLNSIVAFLVSCRPLSISMGNAIKAVKKCLEEMKLATSQGEQADKEALVDRIRKFQEEKIQYALAGVVRHAVEKINDGDTLLTFTFSSVVAAALLAAHAAGKRFTVIVADCRPLCEGRRMLRTLLQAGIPCEYTHLNGLSFCLSQADKVFLGAGAVLSNGTVLSRVGTAAVAMMASAERLPVLVCCETYKFHERVQLDSITHNELGDPQALAQVADRPDVPGLHHWEEKPGLGLLNLAYDAMPAEFVSVIITEMGLLPPTSVAVVLREAQRDNAVA